MHDSSDGLFETADEAMIRVIAFDGDDTLWHNESIFSVTQERYCQLLRRYVDDATLDQRLFATETRNLRLFGYGIKGFMLSMIETAIEVSDGRVTAAEIETILSFGKAMLEHPVELLDGVRETVEALHESYRLLMITKGDLFDQQSKIGRSGLVDLFWKIEVVAEKDPQTYQRILQAHGINPREFLMVGNSVRSDILPVAEIGGRAVHIPYHVTWKHERAELNGDERNGIWTLEHIAKLPPFLDELNAAHTLRS